MKCAITTLRAFARILPLLGIAVFMPSSGRAATPLPSFLVQSLGTGSVVAINDVDTVVGVRTDAATGRDTPLVSEAGGPWRILPSPAGASSAFPTDVNDVGVIVGVATFSSGRRAVRWTPSGTGYAIDVLPLLPGELASYATGINDRGEIVGARAGILGTPFGFGWLYTDAGVLVDLYATYGWFATPSDINDTGVILSGAQTFDRATGRVTDVGLTGPSNYNAIEGVALNDTGQIVGQASLRSTSLNIVSAFRYTPGAGWLFLAGTSRYTISSDINAAGDVTYSEQAPAIYLDGQGTYALNDLLDPDARAAGWILTGLAPKLTDARVVATAGRNTVTGQAGAVLLTPAGALQPPAAPTDLTAVPHPATPSEPYVSIDLSWVNGDPLLTRTYELERSLAGQGTWSSIPLVPPAMSTFHQDTTGAFATTYDYRVRAVGVAGPGPWSAIATATWPSGSSEPTVMRVTDLRLSASFRRGVVTVTGVVTVMTSTGTAVPDADVSVRWTLPDQTTRTATGRTDATGRATFRTSGPRGTYTLRITGVTKSGFTFDAAGSILSRSVTR